MGSRGQTLDQLHEIRTVGIDPRGTMAGRERELSDPREPLAELVLFNRKGTSYGGAFFRLIQN